MMRPQDSLERDAPSSVPSGSHPRERGAIGSQSIGAKSDAIRNQLSEFAERLDGLLEGPARELVRDAHRVLQTMVCRIAVIGQVKAGKSSLINALIRRPSLLPSDVNPWTTAVTRLHFKQDNERSDVAAEFHFFDPDEWDELAEGGGRIRELTERLVPGFEATILGQHLRAMRNRAADRLGKEFTELLGRSHAFPTFDQKTLEAYVCAGTTSGAQAANTSVGRYSDITKSAHLYLDAAPFGFPTTLIDTPGTNDPLLVRDEITRRSLDSADVYIVVLTARQALSTDDVALLRILRGLRKERVIVFVNRIDELSDYEAELDAVQAQISQGLRREFIGIDVPIIFGSARWANQALASGAGISSAERSRELMAFHRRVSNVAASSDTSDLLFMCSGVSQLAAILDASIQQSHPVQVVRHLVTSFSQLSELQQIAIQQELGSLKSSIDGVLHSAKSKERRISDIAGEIDRLRTASTTLEQSVAAFETALMSMAESEMDMLEGALQTAVSDFTQAECQRFGRAIENGNLGSTWQCDTVPLRQMLEEEFSRQFRYSEGAILQAERAILPHLQKVIADVIPDHLVGRRLELAPSPMQPPSISALGRVVALDLEAPWWQAWWKSKRMSNERSKELERVILQEFVPITADLVRSAEDRISAQISATILETRAVCLGIVEQLHRQNETQFAQMKGLRPDGKDAALPSESMRRLSELNERLKGWVEIRAGLDALRAACIRLNRPQELRS